MSRLTPVIQAIKRVRTETNLKAAGGYDGKGYLGRIRELGRGDIISDLTAYRGKLEKVAGREIDQAGRK